MDGFLPAFLLAFIISLAVSLAVRSALRQTQSNNTDILIKAALVIETRVLPVARTKFYILEEDLRVINIRTLGFISPVGPLSISGEYSEGIQDKFIEEFVVASAKTDFEGNAKFGGVPAGEYFIAGFADIGVGQGYAAWSLRVDIDYPMETIILDQSNAWKLVKFDNDTIGTSR